MTRPLQDALEETLGFIKRALDHIGAGEGAVAELHNVRAYLLNILELVEPDPGIEPLRMISTPWQKSLLPVRLGARGQAFSRKRSCALVTGSRPLGRASKRGRWGSCDHRRSDQRGPEAARVDTR